GGRQALPDRHLAGRRRPRPAHAQRSVQQLRRRGPHRPQPSKARMTAPSPSPAAPFGLRRLAGFAVAAAMLGLLALTPAMPASALDQAANTIRVTENQTVEKDYGPIGSSQPLPVTPPSPVPNLNTPDNCRRSTDGGTIPRDR